MQGQKQPTTQEEKEQKYLKRLEELQNMVNSNQSPNDTDLMKAVISKPPYSSKSDETKQKYTLLFQQVLGKF